MHTFRRLCRESGRLPSSWFLDAVKDNNIPSSSGYLDVYQGRLGEDWVALKELRVHVDDHAKVRKVGGASIIESVFCLANNLRLSGVLSRGRDLEIIQPFQYCPVPRHFRKGTILPRQRVDAPRDRDGFLA